MSWTCPECERTFRRNNQAHSCEKHSIDNLFFDKPQHIRELYDSLIKQVGELGPMEIHVGKWNVTLRSGITFMSITPEKKDLALAFLRDEPLDDFPVHDNYQHGKDRWSNHVKIETGEEIDGQLMGRLGDAYKLCE